LPAPRAEDLRIRAMTRAELDMLVEWAAGEGWNPGRDDADVFWATDPDGFVAAELDGDLIGGGSIVAYERRFGFMGFFLVRRDRRGHGLGDRLWHERKRRLLARLDAPQVIGMDGVFAMQRYYAAGGFRFAGRDLRFEAVARESPPDPGVVELSTVALSEINAYDRRHFPAPRPRFLERWIRRPGGHALGARRGGTLAGYTVLRPCRVGYKLGPLFADDGAIAERLYLEATRRVAGEAVFLDVPEPNPAGLALVRRSSMREVFGCARMYYGPAPVVEDAGIFGLTTFELG
jgi:GNAT acetyltransferase-like protein/acetyltransferase (GNAT) family protein